MSSLALLLFLAYSDRRWEGYCKGEEPSCDRGNSYSWMMEGTIREDIIIRLRQKLYRAGIHITTGPKVVKTILDDEGFKLLQFVGKL